MDRLSAQLAKAPSKSAVLSTEHDDIRVYRTKFIRISGSAPLLWWRADARESERIGALACGDGAAEIQVGRANRPRCCDVAKTMTIDLSALILLLASPAAVSGAVIFLVKKLIEARLASALEQAKAENALSLERAKAELGQRNALSLEQAKAELGQKNALSLEHTRAELARESVELAERAKAAAMRESAEHARVNDEVIRWGTPILEVIEALQHRLDNILDKGGDVALSSGNRLDPSWSMTFDYQMTSSLFLFAQYFAWVQQLRESASLELFGSSKERTDLLAAFFDTSWPLTVWPAREPLQECSTRDAQVFTLQQRAIGEAVLIDVDGKRRCMTFYEFEKKRHDLKACLAPLRNLLEDLGQNDCRRGRLILLRDRLSVIESRFKTFLETRKSRTQRYENAAQLEVAADVGIAPLSPRS